MEKEKDELLNFAFDEQDEKIKFYREILIKMLDHTYFGEWNEDRIKDSVEKANKLARELIKKCDEYEVENTQNFILDTDRVKHYVSTTTDENFRTQKPYGTLGEHWKELMVLFDVKDCFGKDWKDVFIKGIDFCKDNEKEYSSLYETFYEKIKSVADKLGIDFIKDFIKACEKCED